MTENVYERRFKYVNELVRMGADIKQEGRTALISGVPKLTGAQTAASDLRAGAALICAALPAAARLAVLSGKEDTPLLSIKEGRQWAEERFIDRNIRNAENKGNPTIPVRKKAALIQAKDVLRFPNDKKLIEWGGE
jgi:hypothetical protein